MRSTLLSTHRISLPGDDAATEFERSDFNVDVDRITFSDAFRRLHDKTQVHGPAGNDYVRSRLTHSMEVSCVGRQLGALFGRLVLDRAPELAEGSRPADFGLVVAAASLLHDIGNPPFGHSGEDVISEFFTKSHLGAELSGALPALMAAEVRKFEGNAQGLRVVSVLQGWRPGVGLSLTAAVLAAACKYPFDALSPRSVAKRGKYNFFGSERHVITEVAEATGMHHHPQGGWKRHPLAYLVEAADDICYKIVDIEDAFSMGYLPFGKAETLLSSIKRPDPHYEGIVSDARKLTRLQSLAISTLIADVEQQMRDHFDAIIAGDHPGDLLSGGSFSEQLRIIDQVSRSEIYANSDRIRTDLLGHKTLTTLLNAYLGAFLDRETSRRPSHLARKILESFPHADRVGINSENYVRAVLDHISGMTDTYAIERAKLFSSTSMF